jgi:hypothetical protein
MKLRSLFCLIISLSGLSFSVPALAQNNLPQNESVDNPQCNVLYNVFMPDNNQIDTIAKPNLVSVGKNQNTSVKSTTISNKTLILPVTMVMTEGKDKKTYLSWIRCPNSLMELKID